MRYFVSDTSPRSASCQQSAEAVSLLPPARCPCSQCACWWPRGLRSSVSYREQLRQTDVTLFPHSPAYYHRYTLNNGTFTYNWFRHLNRAIMSPKGKLIPGKYSSVPRNSYSLSNQLFRVILYGGASLVETR